MGGVRMDCCVTQIILWMGIVWSLLEQSYHAYTQDAFDAAVQMAGDGFLARFILFLDQMLLISSRLCCLDALCFLLETCLFALRLAFVAELFLLSFTTIRRFH